MSDEKQILANSILQEGAEPGIYELSMFNGRHYRIDLRKFPSLRDTEPAKNFLVDMMSRAIQDTLILANLKPAAFRPENTNQ